MSRDLTQLIVEMDAAWEGSDGAAAVASHFAKDGVLYDMTSLEPVVGRDAIADALSAFTTAFSPLSFESGLVSDDGATAVVEWIATGVHAGELDGIEATGRPIRIQGVNLLTFTDNGEIREERSYWDSGALLTQLGVLGG